VACLFLLLFEAITLVIIALMAAKNGYFYSFERLYDIIFHHKVLSHGGH